jgi:adenosylhomocysteine nucleosidase
MSGVVVTRIAIISAMHEELEAVLASLSAGHKTVASGREFWVGERHGHEVVAVLSRIGKVAAATTATVLAERFGVRAMLFTGVAGGLGTGVRVGDVVVASHFVQHDMDASPLFPRFEVPLYGRSRFATDGALTRVLASAAEQALADPVALVGAAGMAEFGLQSPQVRCGLVASGDRFVATSAESVVLRAALPDALAVEMEGAAIAQVCHDYQLPFAAVRTISDRADDAAHADFIRFVALVASRYSAAVVDRCLSLL